VTLAEQLRELAHTHGDPVVTSLYIDIDGRRDPRRAMVEGRFEHLARTARRQAEAVDSETARAVEEDLERIHRWLTGLDRSSLRGVAVFSNTRDDFFAALPLRRAVEDEVTIGPSPRLVQLAGIVADDPRLLIVLVDHQRARCFRYELGALTERGSRFHEKPRAVDADIEIGGFDRKHADELLHHLRDAVSMITDDLRDWRPDQLIVGGPDEAVSSLVRLLPEDLARSWGRVQLRVTATTDEISRVAETIGSAVMRTTEDALLDVLVSRAATDRSVTGMGDTLAALGETRVDTLVIGRHLTSHGSRCMSCGRLDFAHTVRCVRCGGETIDVTDLAAAVTDLAIEQGADVRLCDDDALVPIGGIGATTRF
jgi:peptide chain release factor subunit 1